MFKSGEEVFLDDITKHSGGRLLYRFPINIVKSSGYDLVDAILDPEAARAQTAEHGAYELTMKDAGLTEDGEVIPDWTAKMNRETKQAAAGCRGCATGSAGCFGK